MKKNGHQADAYQRHIFFLNIAHHESSPGHKSPSLAFASCNYLQGNELYVVFNKLIICMLHKLNN
ncbi:hypothetical protein AOY69_13665 [Escherichia coli]|nr:hypothetical protein AOY69_13665 [Escherichia coli]